MGINVDDLKDIASQAAMEAGALITSYAQRLVEVMQKEGGESYASQVVTEVDKLAEEIILKYLLPTCSTYDLAMLTEETEDNRSRLEKPYFWCVDPLDGTLAFIRKASRYSVAIALVSQAGESVLGVVYDVVGENLYVGVKGGGVTKNGTPWHPEPTRDFLTYVTDKKLEDDMRQGEIISKLQGLCNEHALKPYQVIDGGGSIMNAIRVLENAPAVMMKPPKPEKGGGSFWDFAATAVMFDELGYPAREYEGGQLKLNNSTDTFMNRKGVWYACLCN